jgi:hypothetical protein
MLSRPSAVDFLKAKGNIDFAVLKTSFILSILKLKDGIPFFG